MDGMTTGLQLTCKDCGRVFLFSAGEQVYFSSKSLSPPKRCPFCRQRRRQLLVPDPAAAARQAQ